MTGKKNHATHNQLRQCFITAHVVILFLRNFHKYTCIHRDASDQKFKRNDGNAVNQDMKAMAVAVSNCAQWLWAQLSRSLSIRTVIPAEAQAAANVRVDVICSSKWQIVSATAHNYMLKYKLYRMQAKGRKNVENNTNNWNIQSKLEDCIKYISAFIMHGITTGINLIKRIFLRRESFPYQVCWGF